jgi:photosystem II stability/assembly factor-like uncharacterized protein
MKGRRRLATASFLSKQKEKITMRILKWMISLCLLFQTTFAFTKGVWQPLQMQIPDETLTFSDVQFIDKQNGWIVGNKRWLPDFAGIIAHTDGSLWRAQYTGLGMRLLRISFVSSKKGWVIGQDKDGTVILSTQDGGRSWQEKKLTLLIQDILFVDEKRGWIVGVDRNGNGLILNTNDGGDNWVQQYKGANEGLFRILFTDAQHGWALGLALEQGKYILLRTLDGGKQWERIPLEGSIGVREFFFLNPKDGWAVGWQMKTPEKGVILKTSDGGKNWEVQRRTNPTLFNLYFLDEKKGWITGENLILLTEDGGITWREKKVELREPRCIYFLDGKRGWMAGEGYILQTTDGGETWEPVYQRSFDGKNLNAVYFPTSSDGWIVGEGGSIFRTDDGGSSWSPQESHVTEDLLGIHFVNSQEGWVVGERGTILHTEDGGLSWRRQKSGTDKRLNAVFFIDEMRGWAVGGKPGEGGIILRTVNGGERWEKTKILEKRWLGDVQFVDDRKGWIVGTHVIFHTSDGGESWQEQRCDGLSAGYAVYFIDEKRGWIADIQGAVAYTIDGGLNWVIKRGFDTSLKDLFFANHQEGWAVGESGLKIFHTTDGGESWSVQIISPASNGGILRGICYGGKGNLWAVGEEGVCLNYFDPDLRVTPPPYWAVEPRGKEISPWGGIKQKGKRPVTSASVLRNQLHQNYPNPFNLETWIPFQLAGDSDVTIRIYNVQGQLVRELLLGRRGAGYYLDKRGAARWDGRDEMGVAVPSGVYFYTLTAKGYTATRKLVLIK